MFYNSSADGGVTWLANDVRVDIGVPPGASDADGLVLRADNGLVHVLWHDDRANPGTSDVWYAASRDDGGTWSQPARLNTGIPAGTAADRDVAIDVRSPVVYAVGQQPCRRRRGLEPFPGRWAHLARGGSSCRPRGSAGRAAVRHRDLRFRLRRVERSPQPPELLGHLGELVVDRRRRLAGRGHAVERHGRSDVYFNLLFGQQAYGVGTPGSLGVTPLLHLYGATIGAAAELAVSRARPGTVGLTLVVGPGSQVSLPLFGGDVLAAPSTTIAFAMPGTTFTSVPLPIPVDLALVGINVNAQVLLLDPAAAGGISMSQGLEIWIG